MNESIRVWDRSVPLRKDVLDIKNRIIKSDG